MAGTLLTSTVVSVAALAAFYQLWLKGLLEIGLGLGKGIQPISEFPYKCRRIVDPRLEACEDMWLSESSRELYLGCSTTSGRQHWNPNGHHVNVTGRSTMDAIIAMDIDKPVGDSYRYRELKPSGYTGTAGDGLLHVLGITGKEGPSGEIELLVVNTRPTTVDGVIVDQKPYGGNSTIELFKTSAHANELKHVRTFAHDTLATLNNVAAADAGPDLERFYTTNNFGQHKTGIILHLGEALPIGDVTYCDGRNGKTDCRRVATGHKYPNGLIRSKKDGLIYVPSSWTGVIYVYRPQPNGDLVEIDQIKTNYSIDNLSEDANGDIWAAVFPAALEAVFAKSDPWNAKIKAAVLRIRKSSEGGYEVKKIIEDGKAEILPMTTVAVHDAKTGRIFFGSVLAPYIAVCEPLP